MPQLRRHVRLAITAAMVATAIPSAAAGQDPPDPSQVGAFSGLFVEPTIQGEVTDEECVEGVEERTGLERTLCKPAAGSIALLQDGRMLYHNALEGTEEVDISIVAEFGRDAINDQSRVLDLNDGNPTWLSPQTIDGGAAPDPEGEGQILPPGVGNDAGVFDFNDGALFCSDLTMLPDGRIMAVGGTNYYSEPNLTDADVDGVVELEGLNEARIFDPATNDWTQTGSMNYGRWYPMTVTQADGKTFVASGVTKLLKPVYTTHPLDSLRNVVQTETYDPATGEWTVNGDADQDAQPFTNPANKSLPLYPRLHMLPNGNIYYNAGGQVFNPAGQSIDEPLWYIASAYDPDEEAWTDLGIPGVDLDPTDLVGGDDPVGGIIGEVGGAAGAGFRGSTSSVMMTLEQNESGQYDTAEFLTAGGILGPSPGTYVGIPFSRIDTVTVDGSDESLSSRNTAPLNRGRWYGQEVLLPDDSVMMFSGATADEVVAPGTGVPIRMVERFDPDTETWTDMTEQSNARTYHNTAILQPDGRVLVGGHAPISTAYLNNTTLPLGTSPADRDPTFEFYSPPYMFQDRPELTGVSGVFDYGRSVTLRTPDAATVDSALIVRTPTLTHLVDGDQRSVEVPIDTRADGSVSITVPDPEVVPPGGYMVFLRERDADGDLIPSEAQMVLVGDAATVPTTRVAGEDRVATALQVSQSAFDQADTVLLAREDTYPDALAGAPLAVAEQAPLLLTDPESLDPRVADEIRRLGADNVILLGGPLAIRLGVEDGIEAMGRSVERLAGVDRFATAAAIAERLGPDAGDVYLAKGTDPDMARGWEDALSVAPLAAQQGRPILLTGTDRLPGATSGALDQLGTERVTVIGGPAAVSPAVADLAGAGRDVSRLAGADRYDTSAVVHRAAVEAGMSPADLWVATGRNFPDSLAAGPAVAAAGASLLLVDGSGTDDAAARRRLAELGGIIESLTIVGGEVAISRPVQDELLQVLRVR